MLYNIHFNVKYFDIQQELLTKLDNDGEYTRQDVLDICYKLYTDELCSVFNVENILDKSLNDNIQEVIQQISTNNNPFKTIVEDLTTLLLDDFLTNLLEEGEGQGEEGQGEDKGEKRETDYRENCQQFIHTLLFSKDLFYITHKCIVQQLSDKPMESLLEGLKSKCLEVIHNKYMETN